MIRVCHRWSSPSQWKHDNVNRESAWIWWCYGVAAPAGLVVPSVRSGRGPLSSLGKWSSPQLSPGCACFEPRSLLRTRRLPEGLGSCTMLGIGFFGSLYQSRYLECHECQASAWLLLQFASESQGHMNHDQTPSWLASMMMQRPGAWSPEQTLHHLNFKNRNANFLWPDLPLHPCPPGHLPRQVSSFHQWSFMMSSFGIYVIYMIWKYLIVSNNLKGIEF